ncbi:hypothetical protein SeMB42_g06809 [Synchytrium endobioticum]|uniref:RING-type domain-containing protein n=1 Tax=Synchytrium endobioticum TaxID=286115 RepID=A0A507CI93_9FUNG|nr:hypothetical protein SeMB42_g06809 [Synchytrium endobioticum]
MPATSSATPGTSDNSAILGEYEYAETVNANLICCVCYAPFTAPVSAPCGHTYCKNCIMQCLGTTPEDTTPTCPIDRIPLTHNDLMPAVKIVVNMIDELIIYCIHKWSGCQWKGQRQHLNRHLNDQCPCVQVKCELPMCGKLVPRGELEAHMKECDYRTAECTLCKKMLSCISLDAHKYECPAEAATCPYCQKEFGRHELEDHASSCPDRKVICLHARHGCMWEGTFQDRRIIHTPNCPYEAVKGFLVLQESRNEELAQENKSLKDQLALLRQELLELKEEPSNSMATAAEQATAFALGVPPSLLGSIDPPTLEQLNQVLAENEMLRNEIEALRATIASVELKQNMGLLSESNRLREEMQSVRAMCQAMQMQLVYSLNGRKDASGPPVTPGPPAISQGPANVVNTVAKSFNPPPPLVRNISLPDASLVDEGGIAVNKHHGGRGKWGYANPITCISPDGLIHASYRLQYSGIMHLDMSALYIEYALGDRCRCRERNQ